MDRRTGVPGQTPCREENTRGDPLRKPASIPSLRNYSNISWAYTAWVGENSDGVAASTTTTAPCRGGWGLERATTVRIQKCLKIYL